MGDPFKITSILHIIWNQGPKLDSKNLTLPILHFILLLHLLNSIMLILFSLASLAGR